MAVASVRPMNEPGSTVSRCCTNTQKMVRTHLTTFFVTFNFLLPTMEGVAVVVLIVMVAVGDVLLLEEPPALLITMSSKMPKRQKGEGEVDEVDEEGQRILDAASSLLGRKYF